ncbi:MAG: thioredoxin family protein [Betaproteobacteria bacterium]|nr:thioredoxin family protein [Betaproteobacteria bacterium]
MILNSGRLLTCCILACAPAWAAAQPAATLAFADDLSVTAREARSRRVPIMLVFTEASCHHCSRAKRDHLVPLQASRDYGRKVIVREIDVKRGDRLVDFAGVQTTPSAFARRYEVRLVPTVIVVDHTGRRMGEAIVGLLIQDFYQLYLEQAIDLARTRIAAAN